MPALNVRVDQELWSALRAQKPHFLSDTAYLNLIISQAIDTGNKMEEQPGRAAYIYSSKESSLEEQPYIDAAEKRKKEAKSQVYTPAFEGFWKVYQSCPADHKANQSKTKAFDEFKKALKRYKAEDLTRAAHEAVEGVMDKARRGEFVQSLPDAFRWLRDGKFEVLLESHAPAQAKYSGDRL